jgi:lysophospholipase L1-like esterase
MQHLRFPALTVIFSVLLLVPTSAQESTPLFPLHKGDRVAWVGSSSTNIGVWPKTMEFLLRTRHPELQLQFKKFSTGGGTFATGLKNLDKWLGDFQPTVVVFNYGSNDAGAGEKGLPQLKENIVQSVEKAQGAKARVLFTTFQAADVRKSGEAPAARRKLYAETLLSFCKEKGWPIVDVFHPLDALQQGAQKDDDKYTILRDSIHLTDPAYIAWGYFLYDGLHFGGGSSSLTLSADGKVVTAMRCQADQVETKDGEIRFVRRDEILPILPPGPLPPSKYVPLEKCSDYRLQITGLGKGTYEIQCETQTLGSVSANALGKGVNLNRVLLDSGAAAPWEALAKQLWAGKAQDQVGKTAFRFRVVRKQS